MRFITHNGMYHADDVCATALLQIIFGSDIEIIRVNNLNDAVIEDDDIVFDVGGGKFDHHQEGSEIRPNGIPYAAFGLLWKEFYNKLGICGWAAHRMDEDFIQFIDQTDNFGQIKYPNTLSAMVTAAFSAGTSFEECVAMVKPLLKGVIESYSKLSMQRVDVVNKTIETKDALFEDTQNHYDSRVFQNTGVIFVIGPSNRGDGVVLRSLASINYPIKLPEGIEPVFLHKAKFTGTFKSVEDARAVARYSLA